MVGRQGYNSEKSAENSENEDYEKNLRHIFDEKFKERSAVDTRFLRYVKNCVDESINLSKKLQANKDPREMQLNQDVAYILEKLALKFIEVSDEKMISNKH
jgi:hypothetical protein